MTNKLFSWAQMPKLQGSANPTWHVIVNTRSCSFVFSSFNHSCPFTHPSQLKFAMWIRQIPRRQSPRQTLKEPQTLKACFWRSVSCDLNTYCKIRKGREKRMAALPWDWKLSSLVLPGKAVAATGYTTSHTVLTASSWWWVFIWITSVLYDGIKLWAFWQVYKLLSIH